MILLNLAAASLIYGDYLKNNTHVLVTQTELGLAVTEIAFF